MRMERIRRNGMAMERCTYAWARRVAARNYGVAESGLESCVLAFCCTPCTHLQVVNQVLVREDVTWGCPTIEVPHPSGAASRL